jgi:hypothetical protein
MIRLRQQRSLLTCLILMAYVALGVATAAHVHGLAEDEHASHSIGVSSALAHEADASGDEHDGAGAPHDERGGPHHHDEHDCPICDAAIIASALALPTVAELPQAPAGSQRLEPIRHSAPVEVPCPASFDARGPPPITLRNI